MAKTTAKKVKNIVLFDNYNGYDFENMKKSLAEFNERDIESISDDEVWDAISDEESEDYDNTKWVLKSIFGDNEKVIVRGTCGTWQGNRDAINIFDNIEKALNACTKDCDYIKIEVEGRKVKVKSSHHDGTNNFEIKKVTDKGKRLYDNWNYQDSPCNNDLSEYEILEKIWNDSHYSHLAEKVA